MIYAIVPFQRSDPEKLRMKLGKLGVPTYTDEAPPLTSCRTKGRRANWPKRSDTAVGNLVRVLSYRSRTTTVTLPKIYGNG